MARIYILSALLFLSLLPNAMGQLYEGTWSERKAPNGIDSAKTFYKTSTEFDTSPYKEFNYQKTGYDVLNIRFLEPQDFNPAEGKKYPMVVMLHGAGESGDCWNTCYHDSPVGTLNRNRYLNNDKNLLHGGEEHLNARNADPSDEWSFDGFIMFPQNLEGWSTNPAGNLLQVAEAIELLSERYPVDKNRVYLHGLSNGGVAVWTLAAMRPDLFAAIQPMSGTIEGYWLTDGNEVDPPYYWLQGGSDPPWKESLLEMPIRQFQGATDENPFPWLSEQNLASMRNAGATPEYFFYPNLGHGVWETAYVEPDFFSWMLQYSKLNIHAFDGKTEICEGDVVSTVLGISPGFDEYEWKKNDQIISNSDSNRIAISEYGDYYVRFRRGSEWTEWSPPKTISVRPKPPTPKITASASTTFVPLNGWNAVYLSANPGYAAYQWSGASSATSSIIQAPRGSQNTTSTYQVKVKPTDEDCWSELSEPEVITFFFPANIVIATPTNYLAQAMTSNSIRLYWTDNDNAEKGYEIWRATTPASPGTSWTFVAKTPANTQTFDDTGLNENQTYYYNIRGVSDLGSSQYTGIFSATTLADTTPPTAPQDLEVYRKSITEIGLKWKKSTDNIGIEGYNIYMDGIFNSYVTDTSTIITGLTHENQHSFYVKAKDVNDLESAASNQISAIIKADGLNFKLYAGERWDYVADYEGYPVYAEGHADNFDLSAKDPYFPANDYFAFDFSGYIYISNAGTYTFYTTSDDGSMLYTRDQPTDPLQLVVDNDGLHGSQERSGNIYLSVGYHSILVQFFERTGGQNLQVRYRRSGGNPSKQLIPDNVLTSSFVEISPSNFPDDPTALGSANVSYNSVDLSWTDNATNEDKYEVYRSNNGVNFSNIVELGSDVESYTDNTIFPGIAYQYKVKAVNIHGSSEYSNTLNVNTPARQYFSQGITALNDLSDWKDVSDNSPSSFAEQDVEFIIDNAATINDNWIVSGQGSSVKVLTNANVSINPPNVIIDLTALKVEDNATLSINNGGGTTPILRVAGEGMTIDNGSTLELTDVTLNVNGTANINTNNETGVLKMNNSSIHFTNSSNTNSNVYFDATDNTVKKLLINNTGTGTVNIQSNARIQNELELVSGNLNANNYLTLASDQTSTARVSKVQLDATVTGGVNVERYIGPSKVAGWYNLGVPVKGQTPASWSDDIPINGPWNGGNANLRYYDEPSDSWKFISYNTHNFQPGKGVQVFVYGSSLDVDGAFQLSNLGELVIGDGVSNALGTYSIPITKSGSYDGGGWNLVSNPYPSAIDWDATSGWNKSSVINSYYVWDATILGYRSYVNGVGTGGLTSEIAMGQSFFVYASSAGNLGVSENAKIQLDSNPGVYRKAAPENIIKLHLTDPEQRYDEAIIRFLDNTSSEFESEYDALKLTGSYVNLGTISGDDKNLSINTLGTTNKRQQIPISINGYLKGLYALDISIPDKKIKAWLHDSYLDKKIRFRGNIQYDILINDDPTSFGDDRIVLEINDPNGNKGQKDDQILTNPDEPSFLSKLTLFPNPVSKDLRIRFNAMLKETGVLTIYRMNGEAISTQKIAIEKGMNTIDWDLSNLPHLTNGIYFLDLHLSQSVLKGKVILLR